MNINHLAITICSFTTIFLLSGCTTVITNSNPEAKPKEAAKYNARLGAEYLRKGRMKLADEKLKKALEQNPRSVDANHYSALLQQALGQTDNAQKYFTKAVKYSPENPEINNNYGSFLCKHKKYSAAESRFQIAIKNPLYSTPAFALTNAGVCAHAAGQLSKAEGYLNKALKKQVNFSPALYATAKLAYDQRNYSRSQAFLFRYNEIMGENAKSLALCKEIHVQLGEIKKADECAAKLLRNYPDSKEAVSLN